MKDLKEIDCRIARIEAALERRQSRALVSTLKSLRKMRSQIESEAEREKA